MFSSIKRTFRGRHGRSRPASALPYSQPNEEAPETQLQETMAIFRVMEESRSLRDVQLPPIPHMQALTLSNLGLDSEDKEEDEEDVPRYKKPVKRKPVPLRKSVTPTFRVNQIAKFDPTTPITESSIHIRARAALKKRYQSKVTINFTPPQGLTVRAYDFIWVNEDELDRKVLQDIVWVRQRYAQACKEEPTDKEIIWWYDAKEFDESSSAREDDAVIAFEL